VLLEKSVGEKTKKFKAAVWSGEPNVRSPAFRRNLVFLRLQADFFVAIRLKAEENQIPPEGGTTNPMRSMYGACKRLVFDYTTAL
jgi:hypothetical protein